jgi:hypothetical protein
MFRKLEALTVAALAGDAGGNSIDIFKKTQRQYPICKYQRCVIPDCRYNIIS